MADKNFDEFWESTGGKPGAYRNYCYQGWRAAIEFMEAQNTSTNNAMVQFTAEQLYSAAKDAGLHCADIDDLISVIGKQHQ